MNRFFGTLPSTRLTTANGASHPRLWADVRLDHRAQLCDRLNIPTFDCRTISNKELLLAAWRKWGIDCPRHLLGDYAFVIQDDERRQLFCARDHIGARPFYYSEQAGKPLVFGSDLGDVVGHPDVSEELDDRYVRCFLARPQHYDPSRTFFRHVRKLPPGHNLTVNERGDVKLQRYWNPADVADNSLNTAEEYAHGLRELLQIAVNDRLRDTQSVGAHISGGLDCSSIAVLAARELRTNGRRLQTFSWSEPPEASTDDLRSHTLIHEMARQEDFDVSWRQQASKDVLWLGDVSREPHIDLGAERSIARVAADKNVQLMLSGWGGDEVASFNGRGFYPQAFLSGQWQTLARELSSRVNRDHASSVWKAGRLARVFSSRVLAPLLPIPAKWSRRSPAHIPRCLNDDFARHIHNTETKSQSWPQWSSVRQTMNALVNSGHIAARMEDWARNGEPLGLTYAYPLTDRRVMEFCLGASSDQYLRRGVTRAMYREAMKGVLPESSRCSTKQEQAITADRARMTSAIHSQLTRFVAERVGDSRWGICIDFKKAQRQLNEWKPGDSKSERQVLKEIVRAIQIEFVYQAQSQSSERVAA